MNSSTMNLGKTLTLAQRCALLDVLKRANDELNSKAEKEYAAFEASDFSQLDMTSDAFQTASVQVDNAYAEAATVENLRILLMDARFVAVDQPAAGGDLVALVSGALVAAWQQGTDVGEVVALAAVEAQRKVFHATGEWMTSNRPGSWEASYLNSIIESAGWRLEEA